MPESTPQRKLTTHFEDVLAQGQSKDADEPIVQAARAMRANIQALIAGKRNACEELVDLASKSESGRKVVFQLKGEEARHVMDLIQKWLDANQADSKSRRKAIHVLVRIASTSGELPPSLFLAGVQSTSNDPDLTGGLSDVFSGLYEGQPVAIKVLRELSNTGADKQHKMLCREALIWRQLRHVHVLAFLGIYTVESTRVRYGMVSLWMDYGSLKAYLRHPDFDAECDRNRIFREVSEGLAYLHSYGIAHGDVKAANILINSERRAQLADFGLSSLTETLTGRSITSSNGVHGTFAWMPPERLTARVGDPNRATLPCDVYAMGLLSITMYTAEDPFPDWSISQIVREVPEGKRPTRPPNMDESFWTQITQRCWETTPKSRPSMNEVVYSLQSLHGGPQNVDQTIDDTNRPSTLGSKKDRRQQKKEQKKQVGKSVDNAQPAIQPEIGLSAKEPRGRSVQKSATANRNCSETGTESLAVKPLEKETKPTASLAYTEDEPAKGTNSTTASDAMTQPFKSPPDRITNRGLEMPISIAAGTPNEGMQEDFKNSPQTGLSRLEPAMNTNLASSIIRPITPLNINKRGTSPSPSRAPALSDDTEKGRFEDPPSHYSPKANTYGSTNYLSPPETSSNARNTDRPHQSPALLSLPTGGEVKIRQQKYQQGNTQQPTPQDTNTQNPKREPNTSTKVDTSPLKTLADTRTSDQPTQLSTPLGPSTAERLNIRHEKSQQVNPQQSTPPDRSAETHTADHPNKSFVSLGQFAIGEVKNQLQNTGYGDLGDPSDTQDPSSIGQTHNTQPSAYNRFDQSHTRSEPSPVPPSGHSTSRAHPSGDPTRTANPSGQPKSSKSHCSLDSRVRPEKSKGLFLSQARCLVARLRAGASRSAVHTGSEDEVGEWGSNFLSSLQQNTLR